MCLEVDNENTQLYAVGSRSNISFIDGRAPNNQLTGNVGSPDKECGKPFYLPIHILFMYIPPLHHNHLYNYIQV